MKADSVTFVDPMLVPSVNPVDPSFSVYGLYGGSISISLMGMSAGNGTPDVLINNEGGKNTLLVGDFSASGFVISGLKADDVTVVDNQDGTYSLSQRNFTSSVLLNNESNELTNCSLNATITSSGAISFTITFQVSGLPVEGKYSGKKR